MINWVLYSNIVIVISLFIYLLLQDFLHPNLSFLPLVHKALLKHLSCSHQNVRLKLANTSSLYLSIINLFFAVASISITTLTGISSPPCTSGDLMCVVFMTSAKATRIAKLNALNHFLQNHYHFLQNREN